MRTHLTLLGLLALAATPWAAPAPALSAEQAAALEGVWVLESGDRLYGVHYDELLKEAAANETVDAQAMLQAAMDVKPGPKIKIVIPAVDPQTGAFVAYRMPLEADPYIPPLLRIVGIAHVEGAGADAKIIWKGVENDETAIDEGVVEGDEMKFLHFDPQDVFDADGKRVLVKDEAADMQAELKQIADDLPLRPVADAGGNTAEAGQGTSAPAGTPTSGAAGKGRALLALLAGAALALLA